MRKTSKHHKLKRKLRRYRLWRILRWPLALLVLLIITSIILMTLFTRHMAKKPEIIGATFSQVQAERHGLNWREAYEALLTDLKFKHIRIAIYWDRVEKTPGQYDFSETNWMIETAKKHNATITLLVGQKIIRWPECYYPDWLDKNDPNKVQPAVKNLIRAAGDRYKNESAIRYWQLENEFTLRVFGTCPKQNLTNQYLADELQVLRHTKPKAPIMISQSDEFGFPYFGPLADVYGYSMYKHVWNPTLGYVSYIQPGEFNLWRAGWIWALRRQEIKIHELQAEPWGSKGRGNEVLPYEEGQKTMNPTYLKEVVDYARSTKVKEFDLWGAETWYDYKVKRNQPEMWEAVRAILEDSAQRNAAAGL